MRKMFALLSMLVVASMLITACGTPAAPALAAPAEVEAVTDVTPTPVMPFTPSPTERPYEGVVWVVAGKSVTFLGSEYGSWSPEKIKDGDDYVTIQGVRIFRLMDGPYNAYGVVMPGEFWMRIITPFKVNGKDQVEPFGYWPTDKRVMTYEVSSFWDGSGDVKKTSITMHERDGYFIIPIPNSEVLLVIRRHWKNGGPTTELEFAVVSAATTPYPQ